MGRVLAKRTMRELRAHLLRYLALAAMIILSIYLIVSLIGAADTVILGGAEHAEKNRIEDGQFTVFVPLTEEEENLLRDKGIDLEAMFCRDYALKDGSVLRVFRIREDIDLAETECGAYPADDGEILLEKRYCETKSLRPGDRITAGGIGLTVSGIATTPDYDAPFRTMGDSTVDSANFGTAFVTDALYDRLADTGKSLQSEEYLYAYRLNGKMTNEELKNLLRTFSFDPDAVEDPVFKDYWKQIYGKRDDLAEGSEELADGLGELSDALGEFSDRMKGDIPDSLRTMLPGELFDGVDELREAGEDAAEGGAELRDAVRELIDKYWSPENDNLRSFVTAADNPRIGAASDDVVINKYASILAGVIILALMAYVISVFVVHGIEEEQSVIGTLYALGVRRGELLRHYLVLPSLVCLAAGVVGTALGYSRFGDSPADGGHLRLLLRSLPRHGDGAVGDPVRDRHAPRDRGPGELDRDPPPSVRARASDDPQGGKAAGRLPGPVPGRARKHELHPAVPAPADAPGGQKRGWRGAGDLRVPPTHDDRHQRVLPLRARGAGQRGRHEIRLYVPLQVPGGGGPRKRNSRLLREPEKGGFRLQHGRDGAGSGAGQSLL